jgi:hypothetical protein
LRLNRLHGHSAAGRIMSMKNSNDTIGDRSRDLPVCSAMPQPPCHRVPHHQVIIRNIRIFRHVQLTSINFKAKRNHTV